MSVVILKFQKKRNMVIAKKYVERWLKIIVSNKLAKTLVLLFYNILMYFLVVMLMSSILVRDKLFRR